MDLVFGNIRNAEELDDSSFASNAASWKVVIDFPFDDEGHGEVYAERREPHLEPYLGNRYPATDIPQIARRLYVRNRVRLLGDLGYTPVPVEPRISPITGDELDMSLCFLRSMSPIRATGITFFTGFCPCEKVMPCRPRNDFPTPPIAP